MAITLKRQLTKEEKDEILRRYGRKCYATGHDISDNEPIHFDHIKAFCNKGVSDLSNIAPMCNKHNLEKGQLPLYDFRIKLKMNEFFKKSDALTLKDELKYFKENKDINNFGLNVFTYENDDENKISIEINNEKKIFDVYTCPTTNFKYFYATLPVDVIDSDDDEDNEVGLQPRYLIEDKVFNMFRHFQTNPVLQPAIARLYKNKILVFDGQHKIASLLWTGRKEFECKIYINPDAKKLNQANISAHDKFAQTRFYSSIIVAKLGSQFGKDFEEYKNLEDGKDKSEKGFYDYIKETQQLTKNEINKRFKSFLYDAILNDDENKLSSCISKTNRGTDEKPLTMDMLEKSIFANFLYREPIETPLISDTYYRIQEISNVTFLCNLLYDKSLKLWNKTDKEYQQKLSRIYRSKSIISWSYILYNAVCGSFDLVDDEDRQQPFYRILDNNKKDKLSRIIDKLLNWSFWSLSENSDIDRILSDNKTEVVRYMKEHGLNSGYLMGAPD